jgi:hypothetical protein
MLALLKEETYEVAVEMGSGAMIYIPSLKKLLQAFNKF